MEQQRNKKTYTTCIKVEFLIYHPTTLTNKQEAIEHASDTFHRDNILLLDGELHTVDGREFPFVITDCKMTCIDAITEEDL